MSMVSGIPAPALFNLLANIKEPLLQTWAHTLKDGTLISTPRYGLPVSQDRALICKGID
ncbi:MAG: hypothetical protein RR701_05455 [Comamonas sp.]